MGVAEPHDVAAADGGRDAAGFHPVSPALTRVKLTACAIGAVVGTAVLAVPLVLRLTGVWPDVWAWLAWGLPAFALLASLVEAVLIPRRVRTMGWAEREDDLLWREGVLVRTLTAVPYGRLQYVDVKDGPLLRRHGLQTLTLKTAGGDDVELEGLTVAEAERLRETLVARGHARLAGL